MEASSTVKRQALPTLALLIGSTLPALAQSEICVSCSGPSATYRCTVEDAGQIEGRRFSKHALQLVCITELARQGGHQKCKVQKTSGGGCFGFPRTVSLANSFEALTAGSQAEPEPAATEVQPEPVEQAKEDAPPRTVEELARRTASVSKQKLEKTGDSVGNAVKKGLNCLASLFKSC